MNRVIKFRAWDGESKKMWFPQAIRSDGSNRAMTEAFGGYSTDYQNDPIMQFTGLLDKNGKEIYEGDIVTYSFLSGFACDEDDYRNSSESIERKNTVEFRNGEFAPREDGNVPDDAYYAWRTFNFQVIGNIYENPELLTV